MSVKSICGNCSLGNHDGCQDGLVPGLIGGWYCGCDHTPAADAARIEALMEVLGWVRDRTQGHDDPAAPEEAPNG